MNDTIVKNKIIIHKICDKNEKRLENVVEIVLIWKWKMIIK